MQKDLSSDSNSILLIFNLSEKVRSNALRILFYEYLENMAFICFNYRHRRFNSEFMKKFFNSVDVVDCQRIGFIVIKKCYLGKFLIDFNQYLVEEKPIKLLVLDDQIKRFDPLTKDDFFSLDEFNPPSYLPHGNVGTPTCILKDMISKCRLPASVLRSLNLNCKPSFHNVSFDYDKLKQKLKDSNNSSDCEDWERHIQLHNDVDSQARTEERPYETEKEIVWEKGSSGLVHYTDIQYWNQKAGKDDFDEDTVDDWDVDMAVYSDASAADRDAVELLKMREIDAARRDGFDHSVTQNIRKSKISKIKRTATGDFEKYTKGFGSKQLQKYGWIRGRPLNDRGMIFPLSDSNRCPSDKRGLGFYGSDKFIAAKPPNESLVKIGTIFDIHEDEVDTSLSSAPPTMMKFRKPPQNPS